MLAQFGIKKKNCFNQLYCFDFFQGRVPPPPRLQLTIAGQWTVDKKLDSGQWTKNWTLDSGQKIMEKKLNNGQCAKNRTLESSGQWILNTRQYREWTKNWTVSGRQQLDSECWKKIENAKKNNHKNIVNIDCK